MVQEKKMANKLENAGPMIEADPEFKKSEGSGREGKNHFQAARLTNTFDLSLRITSVQVIEGF